MIEAAATLELGTGALEKSAPPQSLCQDMSAVPETAARHTDQASKDGRRSFAIMLWVVCMGDTARGLLWPTLLPLVLELGGNTSTMGWAVAAFSTGRIIGAPLLGHASVRWGPARTLQSAIAVLGCGALLYALAEDVLGVLLAQVVMGFGTSGLGVCRGVVADTSAPCDRTSRLAQVTAMEYVGFTVTPILGSIVSAAVGSREFRWAEMTYSRYTVPAYCLVFLSITTVVLLRMYFKDPPKERATAIAAAADAACPERAPVSSPLHKPASQVGAFVGDCEWAATPVTLSPLDSGSPANSSSSSSDGRVGYTELQAGGRSRESSDGACGVDFESGTLVSSGSSQLGSAGCASNGYDYPRVETTPLLALPPHVRYAPCASVADKASSCGGGVDVCAAKADEPAAPGRARLGLVMWVYLCLNALAKGGMSWHETLGMEVVSRQGMSDETAGSILAVFGALGVLNLLRVKKLSERFSDTALGLYGLLGMVGSAIFVAISARQGQSALAKINFYGASLVLYSAAYPIGYSGIIGCFSKVVGIVGSNQSVMLSWFGSAASLARIVLPLMAGATVGGGLSASFATLAVLETVCLAVGAWLIARNPLPAGYV